MRRSLAVLLGITMILSLFIPSVLAEEATLTQLYGSEITTLNYLITGNTNDFRLSAKMIDTLVEYDRYGQVQPCLAASWEVSEDGLVWTFYLREGLKWVDGGGHPAADLTAHDFEAAAKYILNAQNASVTANIVYEVVEGAKAYYDGTATPDEGKEPAPVMEWETVGVKALDDLTIQYTLAAPVPYFLSMLTYVSFMPVNEKFLAAQGENFGLATGNDTILYCGEYYLSAFSPQEKRVLTRNAENWNADRVYITTLLYLYNKESNTVGPEMYLRGEIDYVEEFDTAIAMEWLNDPVKADYICPLRPTSFYSYFYAFNFDPLFDAVYEPENWKLAANNENFRKAIYHGLDRLKAMTIIDPWNPEALIYNSVTPPSFASLNGTDYTVMGDLAPITSLGLDTFNEAKALEYRDAAKAELEAAGAAFPIKVLMPYNPTTQGWDEECQVVEQQLEALLGSGFIDIIVEAGPSTGFLSEVRRSGKYALLKCNWGPDYADPQTYTDPFSDGNTYNFMYKGMEGGFVEAYYALVADAMAITGDTEARYAAFAKAEAFLINNAVIIPVGRGTGGYLAARYDQFENPFAPFGISIYRYKGVSLLDHPVNTDEYFDCYDKWLEERAALVGE
ncbi:MAG: peptide ABC transporter substrate-binding protein [Firmicutes bacterium]|nr:peptide ABC transporter substrate-binding protein [Bacillota bacterium]